MVECEATVGVLQVSSPPLPSVRRDTPNGSGGLSPIKLPKLWAYATRTYHPPLAPTGLSLFLQQESRWGEPLMGARRGTLVKD